MFVVLKGEVNVGDMNGEDVGGSGEIGWSVWVVVVGGEND